MRTLWTESTTSRKWTLFLLGCISVICLAASVSIVAWTVYGGQADALDAASASLERRNSVIDRLESADKDRACQTRIVSTFLALIGRSFLTQGDPAGRQAVLDRLEPVVARLELVNPDDPKTVQRLCDDPVFAAD